MTRKGKRANIPPSADAIIKSRALAYPRIQRTKLAEDLQAEFEGKYDVPQIETLERKISEYRRSPPEFSDKPWSLVALSEVKNGIPPEALPVIMRIWVMRLERGSDLSVIEAVWIGRLYKLLLNLDDLDTAAHQYAVLQKTKEQMGSYPDNPDDILGWRVKDAVLYGVMTGDYQLADKFRKIMLRELNNKKGGIK